MKLLFLDIETAPSVAYVWSLFGNDVIPIDRIVSSGYTLCFSAKWQGEKKMHFHSVHHDGKKKMIKAAWDLLDEADAVCHYNGTSFDIPTLRGEFMTSHMLPPSPFTQIDLYKTIKTARLASRKLDYVCEQLGLGTKVRHKGMGLWKGCMAGKPADWKIMTKYNKRDVVLLEDLFNEIEPWVNGMPASRDSCKHENKICYGYYRTAQSVHQRYYCKDCKDYVKGELLYRSPMRIRV